MNFQYWNQLSRFQRNIIIILITGICVALLLLLPNQSTTPDGSKDIISHIQISPYKSQQIPHDYLVDDERRSVVEEVTDSDTVAGAKIVDNILEEPKRSYDRSEPQTQAETEKKSKAEPSSPAQVVPPAPPVIAKPFLKDFKGPTNDRQRSVVAAFRHAWKGYKEFAWGHDNLKPMSMASYDWFGLGLTIVDSLDTMYIMDLQEGMLETVISTKIIFNSIFHEQNTKSPGIGSINISN